MLVVGLGEDLGRGEVEEYAAEQAEIGAERALRDGEEEGGGRAEDGGDRVGDQHRDGATAGVAVQAGQCVGVEAVREVVGDHGHRDRRAHAAADLEGRADRHAVHRAVADHRGRGRQAHLGRAVFVLVGAVCGAAGRQQAFHQVREQESGDEEQERGGYAEHLVARRLQGLRQQVEADHAEHEAAGQAQDQVAPVGDALCRPAAGQRHKERAERDEDRHGPLVSDHPAFTRVRQQQPQ